MARETTNSGYTDAQTYAGDPASNSTPDQSHNEYERGIKSYMLAEAGDTLNLQSLLTVSGDKLGVNTAPQENLHVHDNDAGSCEIQLTNSSTTNAANRGGFLIHAGADFTVANLENGYLRFNTNSAERARIDASGNLLVGKTTSDNSVAGSELLSTGTVRLTRSSSHPLEINRLTDDGALINFAQDTTNEGSISVSGTTVTLNGAHLTRWSQLTSGDPATIKRGTVMSNLDEMCVWTSEAREAVLWTEEDVEAGYAPEGVSAGDVRYPAVEAGFEANDNLNKTKVSDVVGDKNVAGVFQSVDADDDLGDFYVAQTGDFVIRIGSGVTVARGDLLESAGDGTAKPQADDIVYSKTIAKVTSTEVIETYDDGSYLVPCVLMVC